MLYLDFETRSHCDLKKHGVYNYAQHASTEVLCMSYAFGDEPVQTWVPFYTDADGRVQKTPFPVQVANHTGPYHHWLEDPPTPTCAYRSAARP
jgi:hypothetical protein